MSHPSHQKSSTYNIGHDPTHWRKVVLMSKERNDRYATAGEMALAIQQASIASGGMANTADLATF